MLRLTTLLASLGATQLASALPPQQHVFSTPQQAAEGLLASVEDSFDAAALAGTRFLSDMVDGVHEAFGHNVKQDIEHTMEGFDLVQLQEFPDHALRVKSTSSLCDPDVKQYSGYLDISDSKHLFFWFFESRSSPKKDPLLLWANGGPGCSSSTGLLFELGPCAVVDEGKGTEINKHAWNEAANMIFIDQPVNVGYSYANGDSVSTTEAAAIDFYAFMQLFYSKFPEYHKLDFHIAAESYGGRYAPVFGNYIHQQNKKLKKEENLLADMDSNNLVHVPLTSLMLGNGLTDPKVQFPSIPEFSCEPSETAIFDERTCNDLRTRASTCDRLLGYCYDNPSRLTCTPSLLYCWQMAGPIQSSGLNPYDVRKSCDRDGEDGPLCYKQMQWIENYLNQPNIKAELGAPKDLNFQSCNMQINQAFMFAGDGAHNSAAMIPELLEDGIRVIVYAGNKDFMCNWMGNKEWSLALDSPFHAELNEKKDHPWHLVGAGNPEPIGEVRSAGSGAGNFTYVQVYDAGHMVPYDQPKAALDLVQRWLSNTPFN